MKSAGAVLATWLDSIRRFLADLFANSTLITCEHFWELYSAESRCDQEECPWWRKCPHADIKGVAEKREKPLAISRDVLLHIISEFDPKGMGEQHERFNCNR